jgi:hypothetical protein
MENDFEKILSHVYELEGLLLVADKRGDETPELIIEMIKEKSKLVNDMSQLVHLPEVEQSAAPVADTKAEQPAAPVADTKVEQPQDEDGDLPDRDYDVDDTWQHENGEEIKEIFGADYVEPSRHEGDAEPEQEAEPEHEGEPKNEDKPDDDITIEWVEADGKNNQEEPTDEPADEPTDDADEENEPEDDEEETEGDTLRVDEKLQRNLSKNLRRAFSINDRFRFRRELFANSDVEMNDALDLVETMGSVDEAEDYFYNDLGWDKDSQEVQDFMQVIKNHFL